MIKYEDLNITQKELYHELKDAKSKNVDIGTVIAKFGQDDFLPVLTAIDDQGYTLLGSFESLTLGQLKPLLCSFKAHSFVDEVIKAKIFSSKEGDEVKSISLLECVTDPNCNPVKVLCEIDEILGLSPFWKIISKDDHNIIKSALERKRNNSDNEQEKSKYEDFLKEIEEIEKKIESEDANYPVVESKPNSKAIVVGAIGGVIAGLAVGGGLFAAGAQLPILAIIGIAVAAAVLTGLIAGGITYEMSKPSNELNGVDAQPTVSQESEVTA